MLTTSLKTLPKVKRLVNTGTMRDMDKQGDRLERLQGILRKTVSVRVARARTTMNYSRQDVLDELAHHGLNRTQGSLSQIENGRRLPSVEMLYVLAKYLETSTDYFLTRTYRYFALSLICAARMCPPMR